MDNEFIMTPSTVVTSSRLKTLCERYHQALCFGEKPSCMPKIRIRYVEERGIFGYAEFGDFFFFSDDLYVWKQEEKYAEDHSYDVVDGLFDGKCTRQGYACRFLYAGADTNYVDSNGESIFVGDVIEIKEEGNKSQLALSYFPYDEHEDMEYCFVLDNHSLSLEDCVGREDLRLTRIGTSFFQLSPHDETEDMNKKIRNFNDWHDTNEEHDEKVLMAKYTPNFDQELWKYHGLVIIGATYNWR